MPVYELSLRMAAFQRFSRDGDDVLYTGAVCVPPATDAHVPGRLHNVAEALEVRVPT